MAEDGEFKDEQKAAAGQKGGLARAAALSPDERREIAVRAAGARWASPGAGGARRATHTGDLKIGDMSIPCAVLEDGTRVLTEHGMTQALLGSRSGASKRLKRAALEKGAHLPLFLAPRNLIPFISEELLAGPLEPIFFTTGRRQVVGFSADS